MASIETTYSAQDLARLLGVSDRWIQLRAKREGWQALPRAGRGGGKLWVVSSMPAEIRDRLASALLRQPAAITEESEACASIGSNICAPIGTAGNGPALSDRERAIVTARLAFCRELDRIAPLVGKKAAALPLVSFTPASTASSFIMSGSALRPSQPGALAASRMAALMAGMAPASEA